MKSLDKIWIAVAVMKVYLVAFYIGCLIVVFGSSLIDDKSFVIGVLFCYSLAHVKEAW